MGIIGHLLLWRRRQRSATHCSLLLIFSLCNCRSYPRPRHCRSYPRPRNSNRSFPRPPCFMLAFFVRFCTGGGHRRSQGANRQGKCEKGVREVYGRCTGGVREVYGARKILIAGLCASAFDRFASNKAHNILNLSNKEATNKTAGCQNKFQAIT